MARLLTERQRRLIRQSIVDHHLALIVELCGADAIHADDYARLKKNGIAPKLPVVPVDLMTAAHLLGTVIGDSEAKVAEGITPNAFWEIARESPQLTNIEHEAVEIIKDKISTLINGMSGTYEQGVHVALHEADTVMHRKKLTAVAEGLDERSAVTQIAGKMEKLAKDATKNWTRTAYTEVHNAIEEGKAAVISRIQPDRDPLVYKRPRPDACPYCKLLYLKPNGVPRVFRLSELMANGTNVGRKAGRPHTNGKHATEYKAVLGAMHPWCQCSLHYLPANTTFNDKGQLVSSVKKAIDVDTLNGLEDLVNHECV